MNGNQHDPREIVAPLREEVKAREKAIVQRLMAGERELWLEEHLEDKEAASTGGTS